MSDPLVLEFTASIPEKFADAVNHVVSQKILASDFVLRNRVMLKSFIKKFHSEAGTLTDKVRSSIEFLDDPMTRIVVSTHQPNLFAYGGVFKKIVLLETLKNAVKELDRHSKVVNLFFVVDHDFVDESWVRLAQLPSVQHSSGVMELRLPVSESKRWQMVCNMPVPSHLVVHNWKRQVKSWIRKSTAVADKNMLVDNLEQFWQHVEYSHARAGSYADLNSFLMSRVVNETWNYSTLFVRLSETFTVFENGFTFLISNSNMYSDALRRAENMFMSHGIDTGVSSSSHLHAPAWLHCKCGSKTSAKIAMKNSDLVLAGPCMSCKKEQVLNLGNPENLDLGQFVHKLSPRAIPIPLLLARDLGISCYASGTGGIGYLVVGNIVSKKLGIGLPLVLVWPSRDIYKGIGQSEAAASMSTENNDLYLQSLEKQNVEYEERIKPLLSKRTERVRTGEPLGELLSRLFELKEEQREVRRKISTAEKIRNAGNLSPCFIDYAVNFGMARTERAWKNHLVKDGGLASPVEF
ncbi:MAG: hypothetical protein AUJ08_08055 [Thaumarchaeota archaeon 13_1_40CM_3_50_5]|nr:MAG: hypothetical protein AUH37_03100 [Candidatus Nitrososphaera sp. 13_1_40CM_48_12]OLC80815.1 MAG: hypothetical protein AUJ08_08055 [Thaumarchaeota archaeon 13_1_40CM_3_50_5]